MTIRFTDFFDLISLFSELGDTVKSRGALIEKKIEFLESLASNVILFFIFCKFLYVLILWGLNPLFATYYGNIILTSSVEMLTFYRFLFFVFFFCFSFIPFLSLSLSHTLGFFLKFFDMTFIGSFRLPTNLTFYLPKLQI